MSKVPVRNLFYLLSYAFDLLPELDPKDVGESDYEHGLEILANILCSSTNRVIKRGLYREYVPVSDDIRGIRGKIDFKSSLKRNLFHKGCTHCDFTELSYDIPHNRVLVTTLDNLRRYADLRNSTLAAIEETLSKFPDVSYSTRVSSDLKKIYLHQNNYGYRLPLCISELIDDCMVLNEDSGERHFVDFLKDEKALHRLFEAFVLNFFKRELKGYRASGSKRLSWAAKATDEASLKHLPGMKLDILLESNEKVVIIDTKFYSKTLAENYGKATVHSPNLYQIMAYLENYSVVSNETPSCIKPEGVLLYPTVEDSIDFSYDIWGYRVRVKTIDLNQPWRTIHNQLLEIAA